jgi:hypothetical protein
MVGSPLLIAEKSAERQGDLAVLISVRPRRYRARVPKHLTAYLDKLRKGVARAFFFYRLALSKRHTTIMPLFTLSPMVNIAHYLKETAPAGVA